MDVTPVHVFEDPLCNQLIVRALTGGTAVIEFVQEEGERPEVIITPGEAQALADAVAEACRGLVGFDETPLQLSVTR